MLIGCALEAEQPHLPAVALQCVAHLNGGLPFFSSGSHSCPDYPAKSRIVFLDPNWVPGYLHITYHAQRPFDITASAKESATREAQLSEVH
jgi:hypothetical protein